MTRGEPTAAAVPVPAPTQRTRSERHFPALPAGRVRSCDLTAPASQASANGSSRTIAGNHERRVTGKQACTTFPPKARSVRLPGWKQDNLAERHWAPPDIALHIKCWSGGSSLLIRLPSEFWAPRPENLLREPRRTRRAETHLKQGSSAANWAPSTEGKSVEALIPHRSSGITDEPEKFGNPRPREPRRLQIAMTRAPFSRY
jgi:hypothetical protein